MDKQRDFVLRTIEERGVKFIRLWFTDVVGTLKMVAVAPAEIEAPLPKVSELMDPRLRVLPGRLRLMFWPIPTPRRFRFCPGGAR